MSKYILAHDLGTTGNKATLYNEEGSLVASSYYAYETYYFNYTWVEQNPEDWWRAVCHSTKELVQKSGISEEDIACISFSGQMMGCVAVDEDANALRRALIWADQRAIEEERFLKQAIGMESVYSITGHRASASYSGAKILWLKNNEKELYNKTYKFLHAKDYIVAKLTGNFVTDYSDASGMNLLDINKLDWSEDIIKSIEIDTNKLPQLHISIDCVGRVKKNVTEEVGLKEGTPVVIGGGDGVCAAAGAGVIKEGDAYNYLGSSSWIGIATDKPIVDEKMRTFNWVHLVPNMYSPTGTMQSAGGSVQWYKNVLCQFENLVAEKEGRSPYQLIDEEALNSEPGARGVLYLPYLLGERSPHWNSKARGAFIGLSMMHTKEDISRAVLEGISFNLNIIFEAFTEKVKIDEIRMIGGGAKSKVWRQIFADIYNRRIAKPYLLDEATSLGAALAGGIGVGIFKDFEVVKKIINIESVDNPRQENVEKYSKMYKVFNNAYSQLSSVYDQLSDI